MKVFHGSNVKIESIDLSKSCSFKDFGKGFYVTNIQKHAIKRAIQMAEDFTSSLYEKLANADNLLWKRSWQEIYEMLKKELKT